MLVVAGLLFAFDCQNILSWWKALVLSPGEDSTSDFTIIVPLFGHPRYFARRPTLLPHQANVLVAMDISTALMASFAEALEGEGWRVDRYRLPNPNPASLVAAALPDVTTTLALRLDADTRLSEGLERVCAAVLADGADLCSTKCEIENTVNLVTRMQNLEYRIAMQGRHIRPWLTSGACFIGRTEALRQIYANHSFWTPGEDIETGVVAKALRMRVRHCEFRVFTDAPDSWRALVRQRRLWWAGNFRHWTINLDKNLVHRPVMALYASAGIWSSLYWKWWGMIDWHTLQYTLPFLWFVYVLLTYLVNFRVRSRYMLLLPFYALLQSMLMTPAGVVTYLILARRYRNFGRYHFGYRRPSRSIAAWRPMRRGAELLSPPTIGPPLASLVLGLGEGSAERSIPLLARPTRSCPDCSEVTT
jgi:hypothetical protein